MPLSIIFIEGNIGAGKTTFIRNIAEHLQGFLPNMTVVCVFEPVDDWTNIRGANLLQQFYGDQARWAFSFQCHALVTRLKSLEDAAATTDGNTLLLCERSIFSDRYVFVENLRKERLLTELEYNMYLSWWDFWWRRLVPSRLIGTIYLNMSPVTCCYNVGKRAREGEEGIPLAYLEQLHAYHEAALRSEGWARTPLFRVSEAEWGGNHQDATTLERLAGRIVRDIIRNPVTHVAPEISLSASAPCV